MPSRSRRSSASSESEASILNTDVGTHYGIMENGGDFDLGLGGWIADYKDPETFLGLGRRASGNNFSHYDSAEFERLMDAAAAAGDRSGRAHAAPG